MEHYINCVTEYLMLTLKIRFLFLFNLAQDLYFELIPCNSTLV